MHSIRRRISIKAEQTNAKCENRQLRSITLPRIRRRTLKTSWDAAILFVWDYIKKSSGH